ncbi:MAG TPA: prolyl oligopeptidase family serine peptidase [Povalibacter sp.]|nr:prolyl oligopeptidase family serine peptidase [Povalibacter sp.]
MTTMIDRRTLMVSAGAAALLARLPRAFANSVKGPPAARVEPVTETFFGKSVTDPYRWMENPKDRDWEPFMKGQAQYARQVLDAIPGRVGIARRVSELSGDLEIISSIQLGGSRIFVEKRPAGADNFQLFVREAVDGPERLLFDPESRTQGDVHYAMNYWSASPNGRYVLYGVSPSGSENAIIEIMEVATGKVLPDRIDRVQYASPSWLPDSSAFFFNRLAEGARAGTTDYYKNSVSWLHKVGTDAKADVKVLARGQFADVAIQEIDFPVVLAQPGSNYALAILVSGVQNEYSIFLNRLEAAAAGAGGWQQICSAEDKVTGVTIRGDDIYLLTYKGAPRYKVLHTQAASPAIATAREVVPQGAAVIQNVYAAKDAIYIQDLDGGVGRLRKLSPDKIVSSIALPFEGAIGATYTDTDHDGVWFSLESWVRPATAYRVGASGEVTATTLVAKPNIDVSAYESQRVFATAKDGAQVPVSVVYKKGLRRDGSAPTMIDAYGSYGINSNPYFGPRFIAWLERGGVWATAHVRGGGEFGREWHEAGRLLTKPNTWGDLIAAGEKLIADRWTSPANLAIRGGSAGGITVGRAMTSRPDLFAAVISQVGVSNSLRAEFSQNGPPNVPEFGSVATVDGFRGLHEMDSFQHVQDGTKYPAVLLTTGMTDPRVDPWQAAKMAARLQKATASGKPVLLRVEFHGGHGIGSTRTQRDEEFGDIFAFILWQTGAPGFQPV